MGNTVGILALKALYNPSNIGQITNQVKRDIEKIEQQAGEIDLKVNAPDMSKFQDRIVRASDSIQNLQKRKLKGFNLSDVMGGLFGTFADPAKNAKDYAEEMENTLKKLKLITQVPDYELMRDFTSKELNAVLRRQEQLEFEKQVKNNSRQAAQENVDKIKSQKTSEIIDSFSDDESKIYEKYKTKKNIDQLSQKTGLDFKSLDKEAQDTFGKYARLSQIQDILKNRQKDISKLDTSDDILNEIQNYKNLEYINELLKKTGETLQGLGATNLPEIESFNKQIFDATKRYRDLLSQEAKTDDEIQKIEQERDKYIIDTYKKRSKKTREVEDAKLEESKKNFQKKYSSDNDSKDTKKDTSFTSNTSTESDVKSSVNKDIWKQAFEDVKKDYLSYAKYAVDEDTALHELNRLSDVFKNDENYFNKNDLKDFNGYIQSLKNWGISEDSLPDNIKKILSSNDYKDTLDLWKDSVDIPKLQDQISKMFDAQKSAYDKLYKESTPDDGTERKSYGNESSTDRSGNNTDQRNDFDDIDNIEYNENISRMAQDANELYQYISNINSIIPELSSGLEGLSNNSFTDLITDLQKIEESSKNIISQIEKYKTDIDRISPEKTKNKSISDQETKKPKYTVSKESPKIKKNNSMSSNDVSYKLAKKELDDLKSSKHALTVEIQDIKLELQNLQNDILSKKDQLNKIQNEIKDAENKKNKKNGYVKNAKINQEYPSSYEKNVDKAFDFGKKNLEAYEQIKSNIIDPHKYSSDLMKPIVENANKSIEKLLHKTSQSTSLKDTEKYLNESNKLYENVIKSNDALLSSNSYRDYIETSFKDNKYDQFRYMSLSRIDNLQKELSSNQINVDDFIHEIEVLKSKEDAISKIFNSKYNTNDNSTGYISNLLKKANNEFEGYYYDILSSNDIVDFSKYASKIDKTKNNVASLKDQWLQSYNLKKSIDLPLDLSSITDIPLRHFYESIQDKIKAFDIELDSGDIDLNTYRKHIDNLKSAFTDVRFLFESLPDIPGDILSRLKDEFVNNDDYSLKAQNKLKKEADKQSTLNDLKSRKLDSSNYQSDLMKTIIVNANNQIESIISDLSSDYTKNKIKKSKSNIQSVKENVDASYAAITNGSDFINSLSGLKNGELNKFVDYAQNDVESLNSQLASGKISVSDYISGIDTLKNELSNLDDILNKIKSNHLLNTETSNDGTTVSNKDIIDKIKENFFASGNFSLDAQTKLQEDVSNFLNQLTSDNIPNTYIKDINKAYTEAENTNNIIRNIIEKKISLSDGRYPLDIMHHTLDKSDLDFQKVIDKLKQSSTDSERNNLINQANDIYDNVEKTNQAFINGIDFRKSLKSYKNTDLSDYAVRSIQTISDFNKKLQNGEITFDAYNKKIDELKSNFKSLYEVLQKVNGKNDLLNDLKNGVTRGQRKRLDDSQYEIHNLLKDYVKNGDYSSKSQKSLLDQIDSIISEKTSHVDSYKLGDALKNKIQRMRSENSKNDNDEYYEKMLKVVFDKYNTISSKFDSDKIDESDYKKQIDNFNSALDNISSFISKVSEIRDDLSDLDNDPNVVSQIVGRLNSLLDSSILSLSNKDMFKDADFNIDPFNSLIEKVNPLSIGEIYRNTLTGDSSPIKVLGPVISSVNSQIDELSNSFLEGNISTTKYISGLKKLAQSLEHVSDYAENEDQALSKMYANIDTRLGKDANILEDSKNLDENGKLIRAITASKDGVTFKQIYSEANNGLSEIVNKTKSSTTLLGNFFDGLKQRWTSLGQYLLSFGSFYEVFDILKQGFGIITDLDDALTEMNKVSDMPLAKLQDFQKESFNIADGIGSTGLQIQQSTADFLRLGESFNEAQKSAEAANVLYNVSEFESIDAATESLIAMSAAYQDLDKMEINDKLNNVGNNFSISTDGLATALQKSASALTTAGADIDKSIALITAGNAVVQDPDSVGAGIRTIALRLMGTEEAKKELEETGEDTSDFVVQTASKINEQFKAFTAVASNDWKGISILDDNGNNRDPYEILQDVADIYKEIVATDKQFGTNHLNALLELMAGKNRANIGASIIQNPKTLREAYEASLSSEGSALEENQKHLDSISGHLDQLKNKWQEVWSGTGRDVVNPILDIGSAILDLVNKIGLLQTALMGVAAFFGAKSMLSKDGLLPNLLG